MTSTNTYLYLASYASRGKFGHQTFDVGGPVDTPEHVEQITEMLRQKEDGPVALLGLQQLSAPSEPPADPVKSDVPPGLASVIADLDTAIERGNDWLNSPSSNSGLPSRLLDNMRDAVNALRDL